MSLSYPIHLTRDQFEVLSAFLPVAKSGGRPRTTDMMSVINAIFYVLAESSQWRALPHDFPAWQTVHTYFRNWKGMGSQNSSCLTFLVLADGGMILKYAKTIGLNLYPFRLFKLPLRYGINC